jgi:type IV pilus assembly protein PilB
MADSFGPRMSRGDRAAPVPGQDPPGQPPFLPDQASDEPADGVVEIDATAADRLTGEAPAVMLVNALMAAAIRRSASDIHVEPHERDVRVRLRVDGELRTLMSVPRRQRDALISRVKIMARLDIAEKRLPQDGRIRVVLVEAGRRRMVDFRASVLPTLFGEKVVLRLLDHDGLRLDLSTLGFGSGELAQFNRAIRLPWGMVLATGPTGSGKTSTLYAALACLNQPGVNILTAEDPVEFSVPGINQVQVREAIGLTFASVLRASLRQDPDILLVGEVRDAETAAIAVKSALTGHLVLSTLHTNDAPGSVTRLVNMGVEPFLVAHSVNMVCAQRLVRRICRACIEPHDIPAPALAEAGAGALLASASRLFRGRGCDACGGSGYRGRTAIFELMVMTEAMKDLVAANASTADLRRQAVRDGMTTLRESGLDRARAGETTVEEVLRVTM